jgi:hypothetical protein
MMLVYLPTQLSDFVRANVGKYSSTMVRIWVWRVILFSNTEEQAILYSSREQGTWGISRVSKNLPGQTIASTCESSKRIAQR